MYAFLHDYVFKFIECSVGYFGPNCLHKCSPPYYGYLCSQECGTGCEPCHYMFGCIHSTENTGKTSGIKLSNILIVFLKAGLKQYMVWFYF